MTDLGKILSRKSIKKSIVSRKTGISTSRLSELSRNPSTHLKAIELVLISKAIDIPPEELLKELFGHINVIENE